jgi:hypothetical protein
MRVSAGRRRRIVLALAWGVCACSEPEAEEPTESTTATDEDTTTGEVEDPQAPADQCAAAPRVSAGRHTGSLRGNTSDRGGACDRGGPDAFLVLDVPRRADVRLGARGVGFTPIVGARSARCEHDWSSTQLSCVQGLEGWVLDVPAGGTILVSVGIDPEDPALASSPRPGYADPLDFVLDIELRNVLLEGERCTPASHGRCVSGTACLVVVDDAGTTGGVSESPRCVGLVGDACASAIPVALALGTTMITIDADAVHTDVHAHSCGGSRRPERVLALELPSALEPSAQLDVRTDAPDVMLALRGPGCAADEELACASASDDGSAVAIEDLVGSTNLFLFVELPRPAQEETTTDDDGGTSDDTGGSGSSEHTPLTVEIQLSGG